MLGLQGKSAKPTPRTSLSKSGPGPPRANNTRMATPSSTRSPSRSGASSSASERPEKLSRVCSPYNSKLSSTTGRRSQSAASVTSRQKSSLGPTVTVKASELFRKNSEPQLTNTNPQDNPASKFTVGKIGKHVRIEGTDKSPKFKSRFSTPNLKSSSGGSGESLDFQRRRPFSFSSGRSTVSGASSEASFGNDQGSIIVVNSRFPTGGGDGSEDAQELSEWKNDFENNNSQAQVRTHPRLSTRSFSVDITAMDSDDDNDNFFQLQGGYHQQMLEMEITEDPDEVLKEENARDSDARRKSVTGASPKRFSKAKAPDLNRTFSEETDIELELDANTAANTNRKDSLVKKASSFDRLLLEESDNILQDVTELINEIKASGDISNNSKNKMFTVSKSSSSLKKVDSVEKLVDDLKNDINKQIRDSVLLLPGISQCKKSEKARHPTIDDRFNFNGMDLSGIELSDITCPQQVMEQSVPNTSRFEMSISVDHENDQDGDNVDIENGFESSDSNNQTFSRSDAVSTIQQNVESCSASPSPRSEFEVNQSAIQRTICSALKLLEEEDQRSRPLPGGGRRGGSARSLSQSPFMCASNPESRPCSRDHEERRSPRPSSGPRKDRCDCDHLSPRSQFSESRHHFRSQNAEFPSGSRSARSCSCLAELISEDPLPSSRSCKSTVGPIYNELNQGHRMQRAGPGSSNAMWEAKDDKTKQIFSFLDEVEKSDQEMLFGLRFESDELGRPKPVTSGTTARAAELPSKSQNKSVTSRIPERRDDQNFRSLDTLIRKGSVELAREILLLERKLDEAQHAVKLLEESLLNQRELNIRNLRSSERDFKKRMKMQKEEFDMAFARNEALINEMATEKRSLQEKLDKLIKNFEGMEEKNKEQTKALQQKHLDEIRRLRKMQQNAEISLKQKLAGSKAHANEVREMTVKGLEPEVQRIIQRHQQEMSEMRAWHADEVRETEERYQRKLHMQVEDLREKFAKEKEDMLVRERELANRRLEAELKQRDEEIENQKRRLANEIFEERERAVSDEMRLKQTMQEAVRKAQIKAETELENLKQEYEGKLAALDRKHESELKSVKDVYEAEKQNWASSQMKRLEQALADQELRLREVFQQEKDKEWREREKKLKEEFEKFRKDDEDASESRFRRMQEKLQVELAEMEKSEKDVKSKFSQIKTDLLAREEEVFSLKSSTKLKDKQLTDLQEMNMKMQEERVNLTSVIRREFTDQISAMEEECRLLKSSIVELQSNTKLQTEQKQLEIQKVVAEKDSEIEQIGLRVKQALSRKDETILELQKQLEKCSFQITHLEELLEEQRKELLHGMKMPNPGGPRKK